MRDQMPQVAAWIDELREVFGADQIDPSIRRGMAGQPHQFFASEAGYSIGTDSPDLGQQARVAPPGAPEGRR
jgi:hypothetical protein